MPRTFRAAYRRLRRPFEWLAIWTALAIVPPLTLRGLRRLSTFVADSVYFADRKGKAVARANLRLMFGSRMTPRRERLLIRRAYRNMAGVLVNVFWVARDTRARILEQVCFAPGLIEAVRGLQPAVAVSAHIGNWEVLTQALVAHGVPVVSVAKEIGTPEMTAKLTELRAAGGQQIVTAEGALRPLMHALKRGISVGLLVDQHTHVWEGGAWVDFFGVPAGISLAPATLARRFKAPIVFGWARPLKDGRYRIEAGEIIPPSPELDDAARCQQLVSAFERVIRRHPSLWCLNYRRWRYVRPGDDPARYPFYAHVRHPPRTA
jgi:KDO2-lipid IV(A) lauroyltransferase